MLHFVHERVVNKSYSFKISLFVAFVFIRKLLHNVLKQIHENSRNRLNEGMEGEADQIA